MLDCGALSRTLAEGTIFGFRKGAFTGTDRDQAGVFEVADGGTLFIDEVGELAPEHQVKLLRALDKREVTRLGEPGKARRVDVRVIAATHRDLRQAVADGGFRQELYYRLARALRGWRPYGDRRRADRAASSEQRAASSEQRAASRRTGTLSASSRHSWANSVTLGTVCAPRVVRLGVLCAVNQQRQIAV